MIEAPFSQHSRAKLERLVQEEFEYIEAYVARYQGAGEWGANVGQPLDAFRFQALMAADFYLRQTAPRD